MAYLTDKEKRLLFSALTREKKVCVEVDKECCREAYEDTLESVVKNLEKKFYYDRFEKEIRNKAIDEFAAAIRDICHKCPIGTDADTNEPLYGHEDGTWHNLIDAVAEQMKAGE